MGLTFLSALLLLFAYPPFDAGWLAWVAFVPWLISLGNGSARQAFLFGTLAGLLFFGGTIYWVGHVTIPGAVLLSAYSALYFGAWGWLARRLIRRRKPLHLLLGLPAAWCLLEFVRSVFFSGFGWNLLSYSQWNWLPVIQIADLTGSWGVSFLIVMANVALFLALQGKRKILLLAAVFLLGAALAYGSWRLAQIPSSDQLKDEPSVKISVLQGNIPQFQKWDADFTEQIWRSYETLTVQAAKERPELIVWPETSVPGFMEEPEIAARLIRAAASAGTPLFVGAPMEDPVSGDPFNSAVLLSPDGKLLDWYAKIHLVPFGEFIPIKPLFGWLKQIYPIADFSPGDRWTVFHVPGAGFQFSVLVCFEDLFPGMGRAFVRRGARSLFVITNDAWFGRSAASLQHLQASVFRAVENRVWVVRAANTGWSGFVDPAGRRLKPPGQAPRFESAVATARLAGTSRPLSFYTRRGELFLLLCLGLAAFAFLPSRKWL